MDVDDEEDAAACNTETAAMCPEEPTLEQTSSDTNKVNPEPGCAAFFGLVSGTPGLAASFGIDSEWMILVKRKLNV
ncbi:hypothetical protein BSKO_00424 [Bryopsis sp. KO-2023]|nr:hypothetical protein BSKO_00424 [Bryopsis sp. KO-2023]